MATAEEKRRAQEFLQEAIENIVDVYDCHSEGEVLAGWFLTVNGMRFQTQDDETYEEDDSELEALANYSFFYQDGQNPALSRGIIERTRDELIGYCK